MRRLSCAAIIAAIAVGVSAPVAYAGQGNPSGTGPPSQSCQSIEASGGTTSGHSASSPGSPFNEPGINSQNGGIGGQHYSESSQYDVACFTSRSTELKAAPGGVGGQPRPGRRFRR